MLVTILSLTATLLVVAVCTALAVQIRSGSTQAPQGRHRPAALTSAPAVPPALPPAPEPQPEQPFDPLSSEFTLDEVEEFLAELGVTDDMTVTRTYADAVRENDERAMADTAELEAMAL